MNLINITKTILDSVKVEEINRYYHGKANRCHCGCTGNYVKQNDKNKWRFVKMLALFKNIAPTSIKIISRGVASDARPDGECVEISFHTTIEDKDYDFWLNPRKV